MKALKKILIALLIAIPLGALILYLWGKAIWDNIYFGLPYVKRIDLKGKGLADVLAGVSSLTGIGVTELNFITIGYDIKNNSNESIPIKNFQMKLFYDGTEIGSTSDKLKAEKIVISKKDTTSIEDTPTIYLNKQAGKLLYQGLTKKNPEIAYKIEMTIYGIPIPLPVIGYPKIEGTFKWE